MKRLFFISICVFLIFFNIGCSFLTKESSNKNRNLLILLLLSNASNATFMTKSTTYNNSGAMQMYSETTYPSANTYSISLVIDINKPIFPTKSDKLNLANGATITKISLLSGTDGIWFTGDDTILSYTELKSVSSTKMRYVTYSDFTGTISKYYEYEYDASGRVVKRTFFTGAGVDGSWFTSDDVKAKDADNVSVLIATWSDVDNCTSIGYDTDGVTITRRFSVKRDKTAGSITYKMFQADGTTQVSAFVNDFAWSRDVTYSTSMSTIISYQKFTLNLYQQQSDMTMFTGAGTDTIWFNFDDTIMMYIESAYDSNNYVSGMSIYTDNTKTTRNLYTTVTH